MQYSQALESAGQGRGLISPHMLTKALTEVTQFGVGAVVGGILGAAIGKFTPGDQMNLASTGALFGGISNAMLR
jgi:outer membrane lipoprotein SlyB